MGKKVFLFCLLILILCGISFPALADEKKLKPMGSFIIEEKNETAVNINNKNYVPLEEVANSIGYELDWKLSGGKVIGNFNDFSFSVDNFIIFHGQLYVPIDLIKEHFHLIIEFKDNRYYIYRYFTPLPDLAIELQTNKQIYDQGEPIAVSLLLFNNSHRSIELRYSSSQKFDLVLKRFGYEYWRWSEKKAFLSLISLKTLNPNEYLLFTELIDLSAEKYIPKGEYELIAEIPTTAGKIYSEAVEIIIN